MDTIKVLETFEGGGMKVQRIDAMGVALVLTLSGKGHRVSWASDWEALHELKQDGLLRREFDRYCYGHTEFYATAKLLALLS